jgi:hypothetical protein
MSSYDWPKATTPQTPIDRERSAVRNAKTSAAVQATLAHYDLVFDSAAPCRPFEAFVGDFRLTYALCGVVRRAEESTPPPVPSV